MQSAHWQDSRPVHPRIIGNLPATISLAAIAARDPASPQPKVRTDLHSNPAVSVEES
jgi:hypothetical protein